MRERRRAGQIDAVRAAPGSVARDGATHPLLELQRTAGNTAVNEYLRRATTKRDVPVEGSDDAPFDLEEVKDRWRHRLEELQDRRGAFGELAILRDPAEIAQLLEEWDTFGFDDKEYVEASALAGALKESTDEEDVALRRGVVNVVEQQDRQAIIRTQLQKLGGRQVLAVLGNGRLEALCVWKVLRGSKQADAGVDANWWAKGWKRCFYIEELSSAPWNVGWPSEQPPVRGAGSALMDEAADQAKAENCDGIGLSALPSNVGFYRKAGFTGKEENPLSMIRELKKPSKDCVVM